MNFFKSVFSDDPDPPQSESESESESNNAVPDPDSGGGSNSWNFGGLIQTLTTKSESIIETYRRDLQEFSTGLKSEIEVAHDSVGEIGHTVIKGTAQIISQGKDAILAVHLDSDSDNSNRRRDQSQKSYSRFDAQVRAIQGDASTYTEAPEDLSDFNEWKSEFSLDGKSDEMEGLLRENDAMESVYKRVVPNTIDHETFWYRYYYKVYKLKKAEDVRARLVRGMSGEEEEELSWDVEEDDDVEEYEGEAKSELVINKEIDGENMGKRVDTDLQIGASGISNEGGTKRSSVEDVQHISGEEVAKQEKRDNLLQSMELGNERAKSVDESRVEKSEVVHEMGGGSKEITEEAGVDRASKSQVDDAVNKDDSVDESDEKVMTEKKVGDGKSLSKSDDSSVVESQHMENEEEEEEEEDLGWDDIEDLGGIDEKKETQSQSQSGSTSKVDLRKRLSAAEEEEDLSWDIEDDDEPAKALHI